MMAEYADITYKKQHPTRSEVFSLSSWVSVRRDDDSKCWKKNSLIQNSCALFCLKDPRKTIPNVSQYGEPSALG
jgi:hypothetical protein